MKLDRFKVYVVEDSPTIRQALIERIEEQDKFEVVGFADTAQAALDGVRQMHPSVLVLDLHLKAGTGYDVLEELNDSPEPSIAHIVMLTSHSTAAHRHHSLQLGATAFYDKSMQFEEMVNNLHQWAETYQGLH